MTPLAFARVPRPSSPFGGVFDFAAAPRMGQSPSPSPSPSPAQPPAEDTADIEILPPAMRPFYAYQVTVPEPAPTPPPAPSNGISSTTALIIGAATLVGVAAIVAFASKG